MRSQNKKCDRKIRSAIARRIGVSQECDCQLLERLGQIIAIATGKRFALIGRVEAAPHPNTVLAWQDTVGSASTSAAPPNLSQL
ncbi:MAG: hypothetical protein F6K51_35335 [Moorea sp. SIO3I8]|uniref:hypothetical protein n=1 Tax=Moorena sp. SIO4A1 TaxID=2607835 RepID=UPI0013C26D89|nr:hypothetical protein [Moorena sp. SIO4A1]NEO10503.1 hypothetical protein [Moorena sp. SIO3I8]